MVGRSGGMTRLMYIRGCGIAFVHKTAEKGAELWK